MGVTVRLSLVVPALLVLCSPPVLPAQEVFVRVPVELGGTAARTTLPFGEPFLLVGAAPEQFRRVEARYVTWTTSPPDAKKCGELLATTDQRVRPWVRDSKVKSDSFAVLVVDGLAANQRYGFCLLSKTRATGTELSAFQNTAFHILDQTLAALDIAGSGTPELSAPQVHSLQVALFRALPRAPGDSVETANTIFDTTNIDVRDEDLIAINDILTEQQRRFIAADDWMIGADSARKQMGRLAAHAALRRIAGAIRPGDRIAGMDSAAVQRAAATARLLAVPHADLLQAVTLGEAVLEPAAVLPGDPEDPVTLRDSAAVAARIARLESSYRRMAELRDLVAAFETSPTLQRRGGVRRTQAATLRAALDQVSEQFQAVRELAADWASADAKRRELLQRATRGLRLTAENRVSLVATSISNFETRARQYVTADLGIVYAPELGEAAPYFGANFYFSALNKRVPVSFNRRELDRWALTLGVTATSLAKDGERDDLFSSYSLLGGAGRRMTDAIRLTGGAIMYRDQDDNPLLDDTSIALSPFVSLSFDFDARAALGRVGEILSR